MKYRVAAAAMILLLIWAGAAWAGWVIQEVSDGEETTIYFHNGQIMLEADGMLQVINLKTNKLAMINPGAKIYWQGDGDEMKKGMQSAMEEAVKGLPKEQREAALKMMQANSSANEQDFDIEVKSTGETDTIAGYKASKYEVLVDGELKQELWLAPELDLAGEIDFIKLGKVMEAFTMGQEDAAYEFAPKVMALYKKGYPVKRVTYQDGDAMVEEVVKVLKKSLSDSQFNPPAGFKKVTFQEVMMSMQ